MVYNSLNGTAEPEGSFEEDIVRAGERYGVGPRRIIGWGGGTGWNNLEGRGVAEEAELETDGKSGGEGEIGSVP